MGDTLQLTADDGFSFAVYRARPDGQPKGTIVVLQEIFGVNSHIRSVADGYAKAGYLALAPHTFARAKAGVELGYTADDVKAGSALKAQVEALPAPGVLRDIQAAIDEGAKSGKVGIVGYCYGGLLTWRSACLLKGLSAAVCYYGGGMTGDAEREREPQVPTIAFFGQKDTHIAVDSVEVFKKRHPEVEVTIHDADHGFNCDQRGSFNAPAAEKARERALAFFGQHVG